LHIAAKRLHKLTAALHEVAKKKMITIIGAGPIGSQAAKLLARAGNKVRVVEEHSTIGKPVQCTGIVTQSLAKIIKPRKEFVVNRLKNVRVHAPSGNSVDIKINDLVIDRTRFDRYLAEQAKEKGAKLVLNSRLVGIKNAGSQKKLKIINNKTKRTRTATTDILVGADGPRSLVSGFIGNKQPHCWVGVQASVKMKVDETTYSAYFGDKFPGFFGWVVPENETKARVGIATADNPKQVFNRFMKRFEKCKILEMQGGLIPKYNPRICVQKDNAYIVGDAATQVKATTGGGLVPGLKAAECLAISISRGTEYKKELRAVERELRMSLMIRRNSRPV
jgi:geranylgeranyl reductase family protein